MADQRDMYSGRAQYGDPLEWHILKIWYLLTQLVVGTGDQGVVTSTAAATSGTVAAGARSIEFVTDASWAGTINGAAFPASSRLTMTAPGGGTLPAIPYTRSAGTVFINVVT